MSWKQSKAKPKPKTKTQVLSLSHSYSKLFRHSFEYLLGQSNDNLPKEEEI